MGGLDRKHNIKRLLLTALFSLLIANYHKAPPPKPLQPAAAPVAHVKLVAKIKPPAASKKPVAAAVVAPTKPIAVAKPIIAGCEQYRPLVSKYAWNVNVAMAIMQAESGCRAVTPDNSAINFDHVPDYGLFQLHGIDITDPALNIEYAYKQKYLTQGWYAWSTYNNGAYLGYL